MGVCVLVLGKSGLGKSTSLRNFEPGLRRTGIWGACNDRQKTCGGYEWRYAEAV